LIIKFPETKLSKTNMQRTSTGSAEFQTSKHLAFRALFSADFLGTRAYSLTTKNLLPKQQNWIYRLP